MQPFRRLKSQLMPQPVELPPNASDHCDAGENLEHRVDVYEPRLLETSSYDYVRSMHFYYSACGQLFCVKPISPPDQTII